MGKRIDQLLGFMHLRDDEYEDEPDYLEDDDAEFGEQEDEIQEIKSTRPKKKKAARTSTSRASKKAASVSDDIDVYDDIPDDYDREDSYGSSFSSGRRRNNKIVPMNRNYHGGPAMEVRVSRPVDFESCQEISDIILDGKAAVINFEAVTTEEAQRIIDFVSGSCYAIDGTVRQISENIVIVTPEDIDITGDFESREDLEINVPDLDDLGPDDEE